MDKYFKLGIEEPGFYNAYSEFAAERGDFEVYIGTDCYCKNKTRISVTE